MAIVSALMVQMPGLTGGNVGPPTSTVALVAAVSSTLQPPIPQRHAARRTAAQTHAAFASRVIAEARKHRGVPYQWGGNGPARFDCSGFTKYVFRAIGKLLPRTASEQYEAIRHVPKGAKRIGDLIFKYHRGGHVYHVGIYAGNNTTWAATKTGDVVRIVPINTARYYVGRVH